jgi:putative PIN family toxin of toxin-antitoxin system
MKPRRVVLDSNIFISAFLFGGLPERVISYAIEGAVQCFISPAMLDEIRGVLQRRKFGLSAEQALAIVEEIHAMCRVVAPKGRINAVAADPDDNRVLECAIAAEADAIVSGDSHLLMLKRWRGMLIVDPATFVRTMESQEG